MPGNASSAASSDSRDSRSRWFVGSSSTSRFAPDATTIASASRRRSPPDSAADRLLVLVPAGEEEAAEQLLRLGSLEARRRSSPRRAPSRARRARPRAARSTPARRRARAGSRPCAGGAAPEQRLEQRRLAGAVRPDQRDVLAALERELRAVEQLLVARAQRRGPRRRARRGRSAPASGTRSRACDGGRPARRTRSASSRLICLTLRLRLLRLARLRPEPLDEALEPGELLGLPRRRLRLVQRAGRLLAAPHVPRAGKYVERPLSSSSTAVVTASRNQRSCATRMTAASIVFSIASSHSSDSMSRWFVGSSSSRMSGCDASARASDARVSSPPENVCSGRSRSASVNPSPRTNAAARSRQS